MFPGWRAGGGHPSPVPVGFRSRSVSRVLSPLRGDCHSSRTAVTGRLKQPTRQLRPGRPQTLSYSVLLRTEFTWPAASPRQPVGSYPTLSPLPPGQNPEAVYSLLHVTGITPPGGYPASCPAEPGLSSIHRGSPTNSKILMLGRLAIAAHLLRWTNCAFPRRSAATPAASTNSSALQLHHSHKPRFLRYRETVAAVIPMAWRVAKVALVLDVAGLSLLSPSLRPERTGPRAAARLRKARIHPPHPIKPYGSG